MTYPLSPRIIRPLSLRYCLWRILIYGSLIILHGRRQEEKETGSPRGVFFRAKMIFQHLSRQIRYLYKTGSNIPSTVPFSSTLGNTVPVGARTIRGTLQPSAVPVYSTFSLVYRTGTGTLKDRNDMQYGTVVYRYQ